MGVEVMVVFGVPRGLGNAAGRCSKLVGCIVAVLVGMMSRMRAMLPFTFQRVANATGRRERGVERNQQGQQECQEQAHGRHYSSSSGIAVGPAPTFIYSTASRRTPISFAFGALPPPGLRTYWKFGCIAR